MERRILGKEPITVEVVEVALLHKVCLTSNYIVRVTVTVACLSLWIGIVDLLLLLLVSIEVQYAAIILHWDGVKVLPSIIHIHS